MLDQRRGRSIPGRRRPPSPPSWQWTLAAAALDHLGPGTGPPAAGQGGGDEVLRLASARTVTVTAVTLRLTRTVPLSPQLVPVTARRRGRIASSISNLTAGAQ
jgi:hypothetical protein